jgi:hypothetical protein
VRAFGAATVAGFAPDGDTGMAPGLAYPDNGPEPSRLLALAERLDAVNLSPELEFPLADADWQ